MPSERNSNSWGAAPCNSLIQYTVIKEKYYSLTIIGGTTASFELLITIITAYKIFSNLKNFIKIEGQIWLEGHQGVSDSLGQSGKAMPLRAENFSTTPFRLA